MILLRRVAALIGLSSAFAWPAPAAGQAMMKLGDALFLLPIEAAPAPPRRDGVYLFKADRGSRKGQHILAWTSASIGQTAGTGASSHAPLEYRLVGADAVGVLPEVDVLGVHNVKVRPDRREAFERFVADKVHAAVANLRPDLRILYYRSVQGPDVGNYIALFALTRASRDKYWPGGSDSAELKAAFSPAVRALTRELSTYLVDGSYAADEKLAAAVYESREWTDYVLVPAR